jgi:hypothetical protein
LAECKDKGKNIDIFDLFRFQKIADSERGANKDSKKIKILKIGMVVIEK